MRLEEEIGGLLNRHDCVIVPGFGGFLGRSSGAHLHPGTHYLLPPGKRVSFNAMLLDNDGLLATHLVLRHHMKHQEALTWIKDEVLRWQRELKQGKRLHVAGLGRLFLNAAGKVQFAPTYQESFAAQSFGFQIIRLEPIQERLQVTSASQVAAPLVRTVPLDNGQSARWKAAAILMPLAGWVAWNVYQGPVSDPMPQYAGMDPVPYVQTLLPERSTTHELRESPVVSTSAVPMRQPAREGRYHIVVGAFGDQGNAQAMVVRLRGEGQEAYLVQAPGKLHRVGIGPYATEAAAQSDLPRVQRQVSAGAWVFRR
jgi:cell division septation protein DedD